MIEIISNIGVGVSEMTLAAFSIEKSSHMKKSFDLR